MMTPVTKISEIERRQLIFSPASIDAAVNLDCSPSKESYPCPNDGRCKDFKLRSEGPSVIRELRERIWSQTPNGKGCPSLSIRRDNFLKLLISMGRTKEDKIAFCIGGEYVCKSFFKVSLRNC